MHHVSSRWLLAALAVLLVLPAGGAVASSSSTSAGPAVVDAALRAAVGPTSALAHVHDDVSFAQLGQVAAGLGLEIGATYDSIDVAVVHGPAAAVRALASSGVVSYLEENAPLEWFTDTSHTATRGAEVLAGEVTMPDGTIIDGSGVGVAVIDTGLDGTHPDFEGRIGANLRAVCTAPGALAGGPGGLGFSECRGPRAFVEVPHSDWLGGHGTHVAGTALGDGAASDGKYHGAAPGATLYALGIGTVVLVENALDGLDWVLENHDQVTPAIGVVNNSWGSGYRKADEDDPQMGAVTKLQNALVEAGVTVVFAAGNAGGNGSSPTTSQQCVNKNPGVICVAAHNDQNRARRTGPMASFSSRGKTDDPTTWPDISAPGADIMAPCNPTLPVCNSSARQSEDYPLHYAAISGTSMAAPHIAGIAAQLLQVDATLTPADVAYVLKETAFEIPVAGPYETDPHHTGSSLASFQAGHGLVDVRAAVELLLAR